MTDNQTDVTSALGSLWELEKELRGAAQNAIFLRNDEASRHLAEARRHFENALNAVKRAETLSTEASNAPVAKG